jgi:hypothetical protein
MALISPKSKRRTKYQPVTYLYLSPSSSHTNADGDVQHCFSLSLSLSNILKMGFVQAILIMPFLATELSSSLDFDALGDHLVYPLKPETLLAVTYL